VGKSEEEFEIVSRGECMAASYLIKLLFHSSQI